MIKTILAPLSAGGGNDPAFVATTWAARLFGGHIDFLYARTNPVDVATHAASIVGGAIASAKMIEQLDALAAKRDEEALTSYRSFWEREHLIPDVPESGGASISTAWHKETGDIVELVTAFGQTSPAAPHRPERGSPATDGPQESAAPVPHS